MVKGMRVNDYRVFLVSGERKQRKRRDFKETVVPTGGRSEAGGRGACSQISKRVEDRGSGSAFGSERGQGDGRRKVGRRTAERDIEKITLAGGSERIHHVRNLAMSVG